MLSKNLLNLIAKIPVMEERLKNIIGEEQMVELNNKVTAVEAGLDDKYSKSETYTKTETNSYVYTAINNKLKTVGGENLIENSTGLELRSDIWTGVTGASYVPEVTNTGYALSMGNDTTSTKFAKSNRFVLLPNTKYYFSGKVYVGTGAKKIRVLLYASNTVSYSETGTLTDITYTSSVEMASVTTTGWTDVKFSLTTAGDVKSAFIGVAHDGSSTSGTSAVVMWSGFIFAMGDTPIPWQPNSNDAFSNPKRLVYNFSSGDKAEFTKDGFIYTCDGYSKPFPRVYYVGSVYLPKNPNVDGWHTVPLPSYFKGKDYTILPIMNGFDITSNIHFVAGYDVTRGTNDNTVPNFQVKSWVRSSNKTTGAIDYEPHYLFYLVLA